MPTKNPAPPPAPMITLSDIYYVLFKHKWKIILCSIGGIALGIYFLTLAAPVYQSEAKLLVRYVQDSKTLSMGGLDGKIKELDPRADMAMASEADILSSFDVITEVVDTIGAEKILGKESGSTNRETAAIALKKNLVLDVPRRGNVLRIVFKHRDQEIVQPVMRHLLDQYFKKHVEIHRNLGMVDELLQQQTDQTRARLAQTEEDLRKLKSESGIISIEDAKIAVSQRLSRVAEQLRAGEVELEERRASLKELQKAVMVDSAAGEAVPTNVITEVKPKVPTEVVDEYRRLLARLEVLRSREQQLLTDFRPESSVVREAQENVALLEKQKKEMIADNPQLAEEAPAQVMTAARHVENVNPRLQELANENSRIAALTAKIKMLGSQLEKAKSEVASFDKVEGDITQLQRKKELEDSRYRYYSTSLEQARFDNSLAGGQLSNIKEIQSPSLPYRDPAPLQKSVLLASIGGILLGLALAFLQEFVIDQSVRKSGELDNKFSLPTFLSIPEVGGRKRRRFARTNGKTKTDVEPIPINGHESMALMETNGSAVSADIAPWDENHELHPYSEALRDRLVSFFEMKGLTHKPKLIALTSCSRGAGVTTLAAGLAASLSETGEGNVLLVDMNIEQGAAHPFYRGKPACGLADVLEQEKRPAAMVQDKLYMVHGGSADDRLPKILPKRISHLLPKLQASDYDYIIFDMPPITQTSVTPRLAGYMDMVFLVVEDEKTSRDWLKQASNLLLQSKANLGAVFNKRRSYVPKWLHQEF